MSLYEEIYDTTMRHNEQIALSALSKVIGREVVVTREDRLQAAIAEALVELEGGVPHIAMRTLRRALKP